jgi:hypothetical protein
MWKGEGLQGEQLEGGGERKEHWNMIQYATCNVPRQHNETHQELYKRGEGEWRYNGGLYTCMELPQWNPHVLLMYTDSKCNRNKY